MNARERKKLLHNFLKLIENGELNEKCFDELVEKLAIQHKKGDGAVIELLDKLDRIHRTTKKGRGKIAAIRMVVEEFIAKVIAETINRRWMS